MPEPEESQNTSSVFASWLCAQNERDRIGKPSGMRTQKNEFGIGNSDYTSWVVIRRIQTIFMIKDAKCQHVEQLATGAQLNLYDIETRLCRN